MIAIHGLRTVVRLKQRRLAQCDEAVRTCRAEHLEQQQRHEGVLAQEAEAQAEQRRQIDDLATLLDGRAGGLRADHVIAMQLGIDEAVKQCTAAAKATAQSAQQVQAAGQQVLDAQARLRRVEQQRDRSTERLQQALDAQAREQDDAQDEEAEETAVARLIARQRAAASVARERVHGR